ncbi:uncharacterized protein ACO6RY_01949 [Pungitius sinensis]
MLPTNLFIVSMVIFLATTVSMAPVEEKEPEEVEVEATEEGELSEEEEDDDDSKSQDKIEGVVGERQTTTAAASGGSGAAAAAAAMSSNIQDVSASSSQSAGAGGSFGTAGSSTGHGRESSMDSEAGVESSSTNSQTGSHGVDSESNGYGQKLMNAGDVGGGADSQTGGLDSTVISSGVTATQSVDKSSGSSLDSLSDPAHHSDISINQSVPDHSSLSSGPDQSHSSSFSVSGFSHFEVQGGAADSSSSLHGEAQRVQIDGADLPDTNGNGRQTLLTNTNAGGAESSLHIELTGLELGHDVTVTPLAVLHTDTLPSVSHGYSHTELVSMATDSTGTYTVSADPTGTPLDFSHPAVTDHTQMAGQVTEQYYPSGQGPEGTKNVELEDTC